MADGRSWSGPTMAVYDPAEVVQTWSTATGVDEGQYQDAFSIDYTGCSDISDTYDVTLERIGDNMATFIYTYQVEITPPPPPAPYCGDGVVNQPSEQCDTPDLASCAAGQLCD